MPTRIPIKREDWAKVYFRDNPFAVVPPRFTEEIYWADMKDIRKKIEELMIHSLVTSPSSIHLIYGEWGGGKTHTALYFTQESILKDLAKSMNVNEPKALFFSLPRTSKDVIRDIYKRVIDIIRFRNLVNHVKKICKNLGKNAKEVFYRFTESDDFAEALYKLSQINKEDVEFKLMRAYFNLVSLGKAELRKLDFVRPIESTMDIRRVLTSILNLMVFDMDGQKLPIFSEIFLWLDETEDIVNLPAKEQYSLSNFLRDILDNVPKNLTVLINFTQKVPGGREDLRRYLTDGLLNRIGENILQIPPLLPKNASTYIEDLVRYHRIRQVPTSLSSTYPFDKGALDLLISNTKPLTPRKINEMCTILISEAIRDVSWQPGRTKIDKSFVKKRIEKLFGGVK